MTNATNLAERLEEIAEQIRVLEQQALNLMQTAVPTDERLERTLEWWGRGRYILIRPDGDVYYDVPGIRHFVPVTYTQRPAAIRNARGLPGVRILDRKTRTIFTPGAEE